MFHASTPISTQTVASQSLSRTEFAVAAVLVLSSLALAVIVLDGDVALAEWLQSEDGPFERLAVFAWVVLAGAVAAVGRLNRHGTSLAMTCLMFAMRELDLHKAIGNASFLKLAFYANANVAIGLQLLGGVLALAVLGLLVWALVLNGAAFVRGRLYRHPWGRLVVTALVLLVTAKLLDRLPVVFALDGKVAYLVTLHEEWLELFAPSLFGLALMLRSSRATAAEVFRA